MMSLRVSSGQRLCTLEVAERIELDLLIEFVAKSLNVSLEGKALTYEDNDGDIITLSNQNDLNEAICFMQDENLKILDIRITGSLAMPNIVPSILQLFKKYPQNQDQSNDISIEDTCIIISNVIEKWEPKEDEILLRRGILQLLKSPCIHKTLHDMKNIPEFSDTINIVRREICIRSTPQLDVLQLLADNGSISAIFNHLCACCPEMIKLVPGLMPIYIQSILSNNEVNNAMISDLEQSSDNQIEDVVEAQLNPSVVHHNIVCDGCNASPIRGNRYKSTVVHDFDLCESCEASNRWAETHEPFVKIRSPSKAPSKDEQVVHESIVCDGCGTYPIRGPRYKSAVVKNFDICDLCDRSGVWESSHGPFLKLSQLESDYGSLIGIMNKFSSAARKLKKKSSSHSASRLRCSFVDDANVPDGSVAGPSESFIKAWVIRNSGSAEWPEGCYVAWVGGHALTNSAIRVPVPPLSKNEEFAVQVQLTAPPIPGRYISYWRVCRPDGTRFGHRFWVDIVVDPEARLGTSTIIDCSQKEDHAEDVCMAIPVSKDDGIQHADSTTSVVQGLTSSIIEDTPEEVAELIRTLVSMGFMDIKKNNDLLEKYNNNIDMVINELLHLQQ